MRKVINAISILLMSYAFLSCGSSKEAITQTVIQKSETVAIEKPDSLKFVITQANNIIFKTILNKTDTLDMFLDTGGTAIVLKHSAIKEKTSLLKGKNKNYKEVNYEPLEELNSLSLGSMSWDSLTIYPTALLPKEADGHFGWNLFDGKIVELDYEKELMIIHNTFPTSLKAYAKLEIEYINTLFCIKGDMEVGGIVYSNRYLFDSGFQRAIVMDKELRDEANFPTDLPAIKESRLKNSEGTEFVNQVVVVNKICFDTICSDEIPVQLFSGPNPARFKTHILGNELLKRFNTVLDFQNNFVYLKANALMGLPYIDAS